MDRQVRNILHVYDQATADEIRQGLEWYGRAHDDAASLHSDIRIGSAVVAVLSPGIRWAVNVEAARRVFAGESLDGLGVRWFKNVRKAEAIVMNGDDPDKVLGGLKVRSFWHCIHSPLCPLFVCVDGHAYAIAAGERITTGDTPKLTPRRYHALAARYTQAADKAGMLPSQMQAITWCVWQRLYASDMKRWTPQTSKVAA